MAYKAFPVWKIKAKNIQYGKDPTYLLTQGVLTNPYQVLYVMEENKSHRPCRNLTPLLDWQLKMKLQKSLKKIERRSAQFQRAKYAKKSLFAIKVSETAREKEKGKKSFPTYVGVQNLIGFGLITQRGASVLLQKSFNFLRKKKSKRL